MELGFDVSVSLRSGLKDYYRFDKSKHKSSILSSSESEREIIHLERKTGRRRRRHHPKDQVGMDWRSAFPDHICFSVPLLRHPEQEGIVLRCGVAVAIAAAAAEGCV